MAPRSTPRRCRASCALPEFESREGLVVANGAQTMLNIATLRRLEVPAPAKELLDALAVLAEAEQQYRTWADEVADTRRGLFIARSVAEQLSLPLAASGLRLSGFGWLVMRK